MLNLQCGSENCEQQASEAATDLAGDTPPE